jgi:hypothetical protein
MDNFLQESQELNNKVRQLIIDGHNSFKAEMLRKSKEEIIEASHKLHFMNAITFQMLENHFTEVNTNPLYISERAIEFGNELLEELYFEILTNELDDTEYNMVVNALNNLLGLDLGYD